jgi:hypothetical protein
MMVTRKDVLEALGINGGEGRFRSGLLIGLGVGALCGGLLALLLAPRPGRELREAIGARASTLKERVATRLRGGAAAAPAAAPPGAPEPPRA